MDNNNNKKRGSRFVKFVEGKGFYIVLFLCVAVIGVSAWTLNLTMRNTGLDLVENLNEELQDLPTVTVPTPAAVQPTPITNPQGEPNGTVTVPDPPAVTQPTPTATTVQPQEIVSEPAPEPTPDAPVIAPVDEGSLPESYIWPVAGAISRTHAIETLQYDRTMQDWRTHRGIDIEADLGSTVKTVADGVVETIISEPMYGTSVTIKHGGGLVTVYRNLSAEPTVVEGQEVKMGDVIGSVGQTASVEIGDVTHLHFEAIKDGNSADPTEYLPGR